MKTLALYIFILAALPSTGFALGSNRGQVPPPQVVEHVDLEHYMGLWYEVARFEQKFQKGCVGVTAQYALLDGGKVEVVNTCLEETLQGEKRQARGKAYVADTETNAKLRVSFFWPFYGDYWIFRLGDNYEYAVVGSPDRDSLWFLSRSPRMDEELFKKLYAEMAREGFDMKRLQKTPQP
jgi:apolipoprotein D and lipocalin family protein